MIALAHVVASRGRRRRRRRGNRPCPRPTAPGAMPISVPAARRSAGAWRRTGRSGHRARAATCRSGRSGSRGRSSSRRCGGCRRRGWRRPAASRPWPWPRRRRAPCRARRRRTSGPRRSRPGPAARRPDRSIAAITADVQPPSPGRFTALMVKSPAWAQLNHSSTGEVWSFCSTSTRPPGGMAPSLPAAATP